MRTMKGVFIHKTWKMLVDGALVRSAAGRLQPVLEAGSPIGMGNVCAADREDLDRAVQAADRAFAGWAGRSGSNRGKILHQLGETLGRRADELADGIHRSTGGGFPSARKEVAAVVDRLFYFAGWADRYGPVLSRSHPTASPYSDLAAGDPLGVIGVLAGDSAPLLGLVQQLLPIITGGNTAVALVSEKYPIPALVLGEILVESDLPAGVVNLLTGQRKDLLPFFVAHTQIGGLDCYLSEAEAREVEGGALASLTRCHWRRENEAALYEPEEEPVYEIRRFLEFKTTGASHWV